MTELEYDVAVIGGGVSGVSAALSSAKCGAKTLVVEDCGFLGGSLTSCGVGPIMTFFAGEKQVVAGIFQKVVDRLVVKGFSPGHVRDTTSYISYVTPFSSEGLKFVLDEMIREYGVSCLFHARLAEVQKEGRIIKSVDVITKSGILRVKAKVFVDATGDADLGYLGGISVYTGRESDGKTQPMTLNMKYCNVNDHRLCECILKGGQTGFPSLYKDISLLKTAGRLSVVGFTEELKRAKDKGLTDIPREDILFFETDVKGEYIVNTTRIMNLNPTDPFDLSNAEIEGRRQGIQLDRFLKENVPGFENAHLEQTGPSIGVRESRQIKGCHVISADDILNRRKYDDVIAHCGYPIDIHSPDGGSTDSRHLKYGEYYSIPYSALISEECDNYLAAGRCISSTFEAQAAIRVTPPASATGQAAGTSAALCASEGRSVLDADIQRLQTVLIENGAYIER